MTKVIEFVKDGWDVTLTVRMASTRDRLQRNAMLAKLKTDPIEEESSEAWYFRTHVYANLMAVTAIESRGDNVVPQKPTVDEFLDLPDELVDQWSDACVEENKHWFPFHRKAEEKSNTETST